MAGGGQLLDPEPAAVGRERGGRPGPAGPAPRVTETAAAGAAGAGDALPVLSRGRPAGGAVAWVARPGRDGAGGGRGRHRTVAARPPPPPVFRGEAAGGTVPGRLRGQREPMGAGEL